MINHLSYTVESIITRNGKIVTENDKVEDHDEVNCMIPETIEDLLQALKLTDLQHHLQPFSIKLNGKDTYDSFC